MVTKKQEMEYLGRRERMKKFYSSTKLKGVKRALNNDEYFEALFERC